MHCISDWWLRISLDYVVKHFGLSKSMLTIFYIQYIIQNYYLPVLCMNVVLQPVIALHPFHYDMKINLKWHEMI